MQDSVSRLLTNAKLVNKTHQEQISKFSQFSMFILDQYQLNNHQSIDYMIDFIKTNNTVFSLDYYTHEKQKEIVYDDSFWDNSKVYNSKRNFINKELEQFLYQKMKCFVLE